MPVSSVQVHETEIAGLLLVDIPVHGDPRGWFKENWQRQKMVRAGLPDFKPVQNNISFNDRVGTTRGFHAEPWDKFVSVAAGKIFAAWVDLRPGPGFGRSVSVQLEPNLAVFVPRGVANAFQTLEKGTAYTYLVTEHWSEQARDHYSYVNLADASLNVRWPISLSEAVISDADRNHPELAFAKRVEPKKILVIGGAGQLGSSLRSLAIHDSRIEVLSRAELNLTDAVEMAQVQWSNYSHVINAAAHTKVDEAETEQGRRDAWEINSSAVGQLARICSDHGVKLLHVSTDYVFDGSASEVNEDSPIAPLSVYGQSKAAGELAVLSHGEHTVVRTSWVIGNGKNFVSTMRRLAESGVNPSVVDDQYGRLTFADDLATGLLHLINADSPSGIYHLQGRGAELSWYEIARLVFELIGQDPQRVQRISAVEYAKTSSALAPRPARSVFDISKILKAGFEPADQKSSLSEFLNQPS